MVFRALSQREIRLIRDFMKLAMDEHIGKGIPSSTFSEKNGQNVSFYF